MIGDGMAPFTGRSTWKRYLASVALDGPPPPGGGSSRLRSRPTNAPSTSGRRSRTSYVAQEHAEAGGTHGPNSPAAVRKSTRSKRRTVI
jgi:hypothetical protein